MKPAKTPTVAIARVLRSLGLKQGADFRVTGFYRSGERIGTYVIVFNKAADETIAANADKIEEDVTKEGPGFTFRVSVRYHKGRPFVDVKNFGRRVREEAPADETAPSVNEDPRVTALADGTPLPAPTVDVDSARRADDVAHLVGRTFTKQVKDYQTDGWPTIERIATVEAIVPDYLPHVTGRPNLGVQFRLSDQHRPDGLKQSMTLDEFNRRWIIPSAS